MTDRTIERKNGRYVSDETRIEAKRKLIQMSNPDKLFTCTKLDNFLNGIIHGLPTGGVSWSRLYLCEVKGTRYLVKFCFYEKMTPEVYNRTKPPHKNTVEAEIGILYKLRDNITRRGYTPCIVEILHSRTCDTISRLIPGKRLCDQYAMGKRPGNNEAEILQTDLCLAKKLVEDGLAHDKISYVVLDRCDITFGNLLEGIKDSPIDIAIMKSLLFQIVHALFVITRVYPGFRHGDLHVNNVMIKYNDSLNFNLAHPEFRLFRANGKDYYVPYFGMTAKIIDFGYSALPEENIISVATDDKVLYHLRSDSDIQFFMFAVLERTRRIPILSYIRDMLDELDPSGSYAVGNMSLMRQVEHKVPSYSKMLDCKMFRDYVKDHPPKHGTIISIHSEPDVRNGKK